MKDPKIECENIFTADASEILAARFKSQILHGTKDISASGQEVEICFRDFLTKRLPKKYCVEHGHIIDNKWKPVPQIDVIIADNHEFAPFLRSNNNTCYYPIESIYAFGEVKSTYYKDKNPINTFIKTNEKVRNLTRPKNETKNGLPSNPLFSFMFFVNSNDFEIEEVSEIYLKNDVEALPNIICFLDKGIIINNEYAKNGLGQRIPIHFNVTPEFNKFKKNSDREDLWGFFEFGQTEKKEWSHLCSFFYLLLSHLESVKLKTLNLTSYFFGTFLQYKGITFIPDNKEASNQGM
jgi:hypothetical protein